MSIKYNKLLDEKRVYFITDNKNTALEYYPGSYINVEIKSDVSKCIYYALQSFSNIEDAIEERKELRYALKVNGDYMQVFILICDKKNSKAIKKEWRLV